jgi:hypothetical protein
MFKIDVEQVIRKKDKTILKKLKSSNVAATVADRSVDLVSEKQSEPNEFAGRKRRIHIPLPIQREVISRDKCCQY